MSDRITGRWDRRGVCLERYGGLGTHHKTGANPDALQLKQFQPDWKRLADNIATKHNELERADCLQSA